MNLGPFILALIVAGVCVFGFIIMQHLNRHSRNYRKLTYNREHGKLFDPLTCEELGNATRTLNLKTESGSRIEVTLNAHTQITKLSVDAAFVRAEKQQYPRGLVYAINHSEYPHSSVVASEVEVLMTGMTGFLLGEYASERAKLAHE